MERKFPYLRPPSQRERGGKGFASYLTERSITLRGELPMPASSLLGGMPSFRLNELVEMRLEVISFFAVVFLLCAFVVRWIWNSLAKDFPRMPRMGYARALGVMAVWGALFILVLTMISGARELMTPGAWKKDGATYKLTEAEKENPYAATVAERRTKLKDLWTALKAYADMHEGRYPQTREASGLPGHLWRTEHPTGMAFVYHPDLRYDAKPPLLMAAEPELFGETRLCLFTDGSIVPLPTASVVLGTNGGLQ